MNLPQFEKGDQSKTEAHTAKNPQNMKILLVDDDPVSLAATKNLLLNHCPCKVDTATSPQKTLNIIYEMALEWQPKWYDLILIDLELPTIRGDMLSKIIRETEPSIQNTPIIIMSTTDRTSSMTQLKNSGINDFIKKPIVTKEMANIVKKHCKNNSLL